MLGVGGGTSCVPSMARLLLRGGGGSGTSSCFLVEAPRAGPASLDAAATAPRCETFVLVEGGAGCPEGRLVAAFTGRPLEEVLDLTRGRTGFGLTTGGGLRVPYRTD